MPDREVSGKNTETELDRSRENPYGYMKKTENAGDASVGKMKEEDDITERIPEQPEPEKPEKNSCQKRSFWKAAVNAAVIVLNGFVIALIICLILAQPEHGEKVKPSIQKFSVNSDQYYSEHETYQQIHANIHIFESDGRPD